MPADQRILGSQHYAAVYQHAGCACRYRCAQLAQRLFDLPVCKETNSPARELTLRRYPAKPLWSLHLPIKQRLGLICLFSIGLFVCIAGVLRMYYLEKFFTSFDPRCKPPVRPVLSKPLT
jgi:hypothetical protein